MKKNLIIASLLAIASITSITISSLIQKTPIKLTAGASVYTISYTAESIVSVPGYIQEGGFEDNYFEDLVLETKNSSNYTIQLEINGHVGTCCSDSEINFGQNNSILYFEEKQVENKSLQFEFELDHVAGLRWDERYTVTLYGEFKKDAYSTTVNQLSADREGSEHYENSDGTYRLEGSYYLRNYNYVNITKIEITYPC